MVPLRLAYGNPPPLSGAAFVPKSTAKPQRPRQGRLMKLKQGAFPRPRRTESSLFFYNSLKFFYDLSRHIESSDDFL
jgi:hypothetical protein